MKMTYPFALKVSACILFSLFGTCVCVNSQEIEKQEYVIDASQRPSMDKVNPYRPFTISSTGSRASTAIVINNRLYRSDLLDKLQPMINSNQKSIHSIDVITDKAKISRYTTDEKVTSIMKFKVCKKLARKIKTENQELVRN